MCRASGDRVCETAAARSVLELLETDKSLALEFKHSLEENALKHLENQAKN